MIIASKFKFSKSRTININPETLKQKWISKDNLPKALKTQKDMSKVL